MFVVSIPIPIPYPPETNDKICHWRGASIRRYSDADSDSDSHIPLAIDAAVVDRFDQHKE